MTKLEVKFNFGMSDWWEKKLSRNSCNYLKGLHQESHEAMKTIIDMLDSSWDSETTRFPICIETHPFAQIPMRKYIMASDAEFKHMKSQNKDLIVRTLTHEEMCSLTQQEEDLQ